MIEIKRSAELEVRVRESLQAAKEGDDQWFADHTANGDVLFYGTAGEEFRGRDAVLSLSLAESRAQSEAAGITQDENPEFECFEAGDAGWVVYHTHFGLANGSRVPVRSVIVLVRDDGDWKRVFGSVSIDVDDALLTPGSPLATGGA